MTAMPKTAETVTVDRESVIDAIAYLRAAGEVLQSLNAGTETPLSAVGAVTMRPSTSASHQALAVLLSLTPKSAQDTEDSCAGVDDNRRIRERRVKRMTRQPLDQVAELHASRLLSSAPCVFLREAALTQTVLSGVGRVALLHSDARPPGSGRRSPASPGSSLRARPTRSV